MASLEVDPDCIDFMMGRAVKDRYHDVRMKGVEYLRGVYMTSGIRIRPRIKMNKIDALKEILQTWGLDPQKILTHEALAQITPTAKQEQADNRDTAVIQQNSKNHQSSDPSTKINWCIQMKFLTVTKGPSGRRLKQPFTLEIPETENAAREKTTAIRHRHVCRMASQVGEIHFRKLHNY